jgi:hexosaminidase
MADLLMRIPEARAVNLALFKKPAVPILSLLLLIIAIPAPAQSPVDLNVMPLPAKFQLASGALKIDGAFTYAFAGFRDARLERAGQRFLATLNHQTGIVCGHSPVDPAKATLLITTDHDSKPVQELGEDESYTLDVTPSGAKLHAANALGTLRGLQTFLQLVSVRSDGFAATAVNIQDQPRFQWRGLMIDVARHFVPLDVIKRNLDGMEAVKLNVFHWHLSDNEGFRVESRKFPKLQEDGSDGQYYTQEEVRDLVAYARDRGIRVVPEFDMPGHSTAWLVGYP